MRIVRNSILLAAVVGSLLVAATSTITYGSDVAQLGAPTNRQVADAVRFRTTFGFDASASRVAASFADRSAFPNDEFGVPLTPAEAADMNRRIRLQQDAIPAAEFAASRPNYAGIYRDQLSGGIPVFLFTEVGSDDASAIQALLPKGAAFRVERAARTFSDLLEIQSQIGDAIPDLSKLGVDVILTGIDEQANKVVVGLTSDLRSGGETLRGRFGDALVVRHQELGQADACTGPNNCPPLKGGLGILAPDNGPCTSAYIAKRTDTGQFVMVTAGHCIAVHGGQGAQWRHGSGADLIQIGQAQKNTWVAGANADVGLIGIYTASVPATKNQFLAQVGDLRNLTSRVSLGNQHVGDVACRSGRTSGRTCGTIAVVNVDRQSCVGTTCKTIHHMVEVSFDSTGGDSGGPMYYGSAGLGLHIHSDPDSQPNAHGWYSPLDWAISEYQSRWGIPYNYCFTTAC